MMLRHIFVLATISPIHFNLTVHCAAAAGWKKERERKRERERERERE
jgi:hypothetical protein